MLFVCNEKERYQRTFFCEKMYEPLLCTNILFASITPFDVCCRNVLLYFLPKWTIFVSWHFVPLKSNIWAYCKYDNGYVVKEAIEAKGDISHSPTHGGGFHLRDRLDSKQTYFSVVHAQPTTNSVKNLHLIHRKTYVKA